MLSFDNLATRSMPSFIFTWRSCIMSSGRLSCTLLFLICWMICGCKQSKVNSRFTSWVLNFLVALMASLTPSYNSWKGAPPRKFKVKDMITTTHTTVQNQQLNLYLYFSLVLPTLYLAAGWIVAQIRLIDCRWLEKQFISSSCLRSLIMNGTDSLLLQKWTSIAS